MNLSSPNNFVAIISVFRITVSTHKLQFAIQIQKITVNLDLVQRQTKFRKLNKNIIKSHQNLINIYQLQ